MNLVLFCFVVVPHSWVVVNLKFSFETSKKIFNTDEDDDERPKTCHKVIFKDLVKLPTRE